MPVNYEWRGLNEFLKKIRKKPEVLGPAVEGVLFEEAAELIAEAKRETPVDEGTLRSSGHVQLPEVENGTITVACGFGGPAGSGNQGGTNSEAVGYAVYVHEDLNAHHNVGNAKFLENPLNRRKATMVGRMIQRLRARLRSK